MDCFAQYESPIGMMTLVSDGGVLTGLRFGTQESSSANLPLFDEVRRWMDIYFSGREPGFTPPLALLGTEFQKRVWQVLLAIPYGQTVSYGDIAQRIGCRSAQAIGGAVHRHPIAIIVPCHRVIGADGSLTGYASGLERKRYLLELESAHSLD